MKFEYDANDIISLYDKRSTEGDENRLREIAQTMRSLCRLEHVVKIPKQYKAITREVRTPFIRDSWHRITSSLITKAPVIHITPKDERKAEYRDAANIAERFDNAMVERINKERGSDIDYNVAAALVRDGESIIKVVHRKDAWANFPGLKSTESADDYSDRIDIYKRGVDLPISWSDVDRLNVIYENGEYGDEWVIEYGEYTRPFLKANYGMNDEDLATPARTLEGKPYPKGLHPSSSGSNVKIEFFTPKQWSVIINGKDAPGFPKENPYAPYLPYIRASAYESESLLYSLMYLVPRLDELLTMKLNWGTLAAYPNPVLSTVPNTGNTIPALSGPFGGGTGPDAAAPPFTWTPGKMIDLPVGRALSFLSPPPVGKDLNDMVVIFKSLIDIAGIPSAMRGVSGGGDSGYMYAQMRAAAEMAYKLAIISLQRQREKAHELTHWIIENVVQQTVYVLGWSATNPKNGKPVDKAKNTWLGLSPDKSVKGMVAKIDLIGPVSCQYRPSMPTDTQANAMIALQLTNASKPLYDVRTALEQLLQEEDPDRIIDAIAVETEINNNPDLKRAWVTAALKEANMLPASPPPQPMPLPMPSPMNVSPLEPMEGGPAVPGLNMPMQPQKPMPTGVGGRAPGMYPGQPSGPNMGA